jgi:hypothetical protein
MAQGNDTARKVAVRLTEALLIAVLTAGASVWATQKVIMVRLEVLRDAQAEHRQRPWHDQAGQKILTLEHRVNVVEQRVSPHP